MKLKTIVNEVLADSYVLYHGTSESPEKIKAHGLISHGRHNAVFLTDNPEWAIEYAQTDQDRTGLDNITLVSVNAKDLDQKYLRGDIDHTTIEDWMESLKETEQCMYLGSIPPRLLTIKSL